MVCGKKKFITLEIKLFSIFCLVLYPYLFLGYITTSFLPWGYTQGGQQTITKTRWELTSQQTFWCPFKTLFFLTSKLWKSSESWHHQLSVDYKKKGDYLSNKCLFEIGNTLLVFWIISNMHGWKALSQFPTHTIQMLNMSLFIFLYLKQNK